MEFSLHSNMLLVLSKSHTTQASSTFELSFDRDGRQDSGVISCIAVWDFLEGHKDILCQSHLGVNVLEGKWNFYLGAEANEFVTVSERSYHYWKISNNLTL